MFKGEIEVYKIVNGEPEFVFKEDNLLVVGSSELIADMLSFNITPDVKASNTFSAILNPSNFSIQAVSFGKGSNAYLSDSAYQGLNYYLSAFDVYYVSGGDVIVTHLSATNFVSSFNYPLVLGTEISINDRWLEPSSLTMYERQVSSNIEDFGQNKNAMFSTANRYEPSSIYIGCYAPPQSSGINYQFKQASPYSTAYFNPALNFIGAFNSVSSMDRRGFLKTNYSYEGLAESGRAIISASDSGTPTSAQFISNPMISVKITMASGDVGLAGLYGGITTLGLWGLDLRETLKLEVPPFSWVNALGNTNRKFRLFSKKGLTKNLAHIQDTVFNGADSYTPLVIKWKLNLNIKNYMG